MSNHRSLFVTAVVSAALVAGAAVVAQNYIPDTLHKGTSLAGWHVMGDASWRAENGEYVGTPKGADGGWLVFDKSLQDTGVFARFRCTGSCKTGVLLRAEKTATGFKGIYLALSGEDVASYAVTLDAHGKELSTG